MIRRVGVRLVAPVPSSPPRPTIPSLADLDVRIATSRLVLRPFADADVDALWPTVSDPTFPKHMSWAAHATRDETLEFVRLMRSSRDKGSSIVWAIEHEGQAAGCVGLDMQWSLRALRLDRAELGYWLASPLHGRGLMTEAALAVVQFGFDTLSLHKLVVRCFADNIASRRVIEKLAFRYVGTFREDVWRDGRWHDHLVYELTAAEWSDVATTMRVSRPRPA